MKLSSKDKLILRLICLAAFNNKKAHSISFDEGFDYDEYLTKRHYYNAKQAMINNAIKLLDSSRNSKISYYITRQNDMPIYYFSVGSKQLSFHAPRKKQVYKGTPCDWDGKDTYLTAQFLWNKYIRKDRGMI